MTVNQLILKVAITEMFTITCCTNDTFAKNRNALLSYTLLLPGGQIDLIT